MHSPLSIVLMVSIADIDVLCCRSDYCLVAVKFRLSFNADGRCHGANAAVCSLSQC